MSAEMSSCLLPGCVPGLSDTVDERWYMSSPHTHWFMRVIACSALYGEVFVCLRLSSFFFFFPIAEVQLHHVAVLDVDINSTLQVKTHKSHSQTYY